MKLIYSKPAPEYVKFQRIFMGWLSIAALFLRSPELVWLFWGVTLLGLFTGTSGSLTTLLYRLGRLTFQIELVKIGEHHIRYYQVNTAVDFIDHLMRIVAASIALALYYTDMATAAWVVMAFLSVFMMLSAYFGFCLSALSYIALQSLHARFRSMTRGALPACEGRTAGTEGKVNQNCILARHCFTPYKRCDSCHTNIDNCLGTKFNVTLILVGVLMSTFLFDPAPAVTQAVILAIISLIFWLGYQVNYATDDLAESVDSNLGLNAQLREYNLSLEEKVQKRTAEIQRLATYDMLTGLFNRFVFEKRLLEAHEQVRAGNGTYHLAFIDMDKFKRVNDTAGHLAGDRLLCLFAELLTEAVGDKGVIGRLGGDEFAILFQEVEQEEALRICNDICARVRALDFDWDGLHFTIGSSIGLAQIDKSMQDIKAVMHHADVACYQSKKAGGTQVSVTTT